MQDFRLIGALHFGHFLWAINVAFRHSSQKTWPHLVDVGFRVGRNSSKHIGQDNTTVSPSTESFIAGAGSAGFELLTGALLLSLLNLDWSKIIPFDDSLRTIGLAAEWNSPPKFSSFEKLVYDPWYDGKLIFSVTSWLSSGSYERYCGLSTSCERVLPIVNLILGTGGGGGVGVSVVKSIIATGGGVLGAGARTRRRVDTFGCDAIVENDVDCPASWFSTTWLFHWEFWLSVGWTNGLVAEDMLGPEFRLYDKSSPKFACGDLGLVIGDRDLARGTVLSCRGMQTRQFAVVHGRFRPSPKDNIGSLVLYPVPEYDIFIFYIFV